MYGLSWWYDHDDHIGQVFDHEYRYIWIMVGAIYFCDLKMVVTYIY